MMKTYARTNNIYEGNFGIELGKWYEVSYEEMVRCLSGWRNHLFLVGKHLVHADRYEIVQVFEK